MSHYIGPSSLPSDYALLSRYAGHHPDGLEAPQDRLELAPEDVVLEEEAELEEEHAFPVPPPRPKYPTKYIPPPTVVTESTPLLNPPVPRIDEEVDREIMLGEEEEEGLQGFEGAEEEEEEARERRLKVGRATVFGEEVRILTRYSLPVFGTHLLEFSLVMVSVISIGHLSTTALAAISLGSMTANVTGLSIIQGFTSALDTMLPSAWTSPQPQLVGLWTQRMVVIQAVLLIPMYLVWFNAEGLLLFLKQDPEVAHLAAVYLKWVSIGLPAYAFNCVSRRYFQSQGLFAVPTQIIFVVAPINVFLNYFLVWGPAPFRLGFIGAPIATAISFNLVSLMSIAYGVFYVPRTAWYPLSRRMFTSLGVLVQLGLAGVGQTASEWWAWELVALAASLLGPVALATQSVLLISASTTYQAPFALGVATSVRIGNLLGEGKAQRAGIASNASIVMALVLSTASSVMFMLFRYRWAYLFNNDPEVVSLTAAILPLVALFQVFDGNSAITAGILRARGKQVTGALLNLSAYYIIGIPFGLWLAFSRDMQLHGLWIGLTVSLVYSSLFGTALCLSTDWEKEAWKVEQRLKEQDRVRRMSIARRDAAERGLLGVGVGVEGNGR